MRNELPGGDAVVLAATNPQAGRFPEIYANHLELADYIRSWSDRMEPELSAIGRLSDRSFSEDDYLLGYIRALRDLAEHLVIGDALPDGPLNVMLAQTA